jgi:hypothetical protein
LPQEFDVVCLGGGVAGEAIAVGLQDSGLTLFIHPFPTFNRMLGASLNELADKVAAKGEHHEQHASQH